MLTVWSFLICWQSAFVSRVIALFLVLMWDGLKKASVCGVCLLSCITRQVFNWDVLCLDRRTSGAFIQPTTSPTLSVTPLRTSPTLFALRSSRAIVPCTTGYVMQWTSTVQFSGSTEDSTWTTVSCPREKSSRYQFKLQLCLYSFQNSLGFLYRKSRPTIQRSLYQKQWLKPIDFWYLQIRKLKYIWSFGYLKAVYPFSTLC